MKKHFLLMSALLCCIFALTSCGGDDEPKVTTEAKVSYKLTFDQDVIAASSIIVYYIGDNGVVRFEPVTTTTWSKNVTSTKFPAEFAVQIAYSPKEASQLTQETYNLMVNAEIEGNLSTGERFSFSRSFIGSPTPKDNVIKTLENHSGDAMGYKVTKNGTATAMSNINLR